MRKKSIKNDYQKSIIRYQQFVRHISHINIIFTFACNKTKINCQCKTNTVSITELSLKKKCELSQYKTEGIRCTRQQNDKDYGKLYISINSYERMKMFIIKKIQEKCNIQSRNGPLVKIH